MTAKRQPVKPSLAPPFMAFHLLVILPSLSPNKVSTLKCGFRSSILGLWLPLSTLNSTPYDAKHMTWGLGGVLTLPNRGITPPIFYRFISAHWISSLTLVSLYFDSIQLFFNRSKFEHSFVI